MTINKSNCIICENRSCAASFLSDEQLGILSGNCEEVFFKAGETLIKQGTLTSHIIYLKSGLIKAHMTGPTGKNQIIKITQQGAYLGIPTIIGDRVNNYSVTALTPVRSCFIDTAVFKQLLLLNPEFTYRILEGTCKEGLCNLHKFVNQSQKHTAGKLAEALLLFANDIYEKNEFELPLSRQELADLTGVTREGIISTLKELKDEGVLVVKAKRINIIDKEKLESISLKG